MAARVGVKTDLFSATIIVVVFWTVVSSLLSGANMLLHLPKFWLYGILATVAGASIGWVGYIVLRKTIPAIGCTYHPKNDDLIVKLYLSIDPTKNETRALPPPYPKKVPKRAKLSKELLESLRKWPDYDKYVEKHPVHGMVFNAIAATMAAKPVAASHVPGGHAGLSLLEHSINVVRAASRMAKSYVYYGLYRNDLLMRPVQSSTGYYRFDPEDPVIPLAALAHDIGKLVSYDLVDGKTVKVMEAHDTPGRRLLSLIPEIYLLSTEDKHALLMAVGYYHHIHGGIADGAYRDGIPYSDWIPDRVYAMVHFIEYVDIQTGRIESGQKPLPFFVPDWAQNRAEGDPQPDVGAQPKRAEGEVLAKPKQAESAPEEAVTPKPPTQSAPVVTEAKVQSVYMQWFQEALVEQTGPAHRYGDIVVISEMRWRKWLKIRGKPVENPSSLMRQYGRGVIHPLTAKLLKELAEQGWLVLEVEQKKYSPLEALYDVSMDMGEGKTYRIEYAIVLNDQCPVFGRVRKSKFPLIIEGSSFGNRATDEGPIEPTIDDERPTEDDFLYWLKTLQENKGGGLAMFAERRVGDKTLILVDVSDIPDIYASLDLTGLGKLTEDKRFLQIDKGVFARIEGKYIEDEERKKNK